MRTNPFGTNLVNNIIYTNNLYIASGSGGKIVTSPDTITWTLQTNPFSTTDNIREIAYGNGLFIVGSESSVYTSPDGITWTLREKINTTIRTIIYGNGLFISGGAKIYTAQWPAT